MWGEWYNGYRWGTGSAPSETGDNMKADIELAVHHDVDVTCGMVLNRGDKVRLVHLQDAGVIMVRVNDEGCYHRLDTGAEVVIMAQADAQ